MPVATSLLQDRVSLLQNSRSLVSDPPEPVASDSAGLSPSLFVFCLSPPASHVLCFFFFFSSPLSSRGKDKQAVKLHFVTRCQMCVSVVLRGQIPLSVLLPLSFSKRSSCTNTFFFYSRAENAKNPYCLTTIASPAFHSSFGSTG